MPIPIADALFRPRGIAVIGASNDPAKLSGRPLDYLLRLGYAGGVYPVNPNRPQVQGVRAYAALSEVDGPVDLAIVVVPASAVVQVLTDCAEAGVSAAIVFASGFAEIGAAGEPMQADIARIAKTTGLRVLGPNCLGAFCLPTSVFATFSSAFDEESAFPDDAIAIVSQSGAVGTFIFASLVSEGVGIRYYANTGNEADLTVGELLAGLAHNDDVSVLIGYLEDGRRLGSVAEAAATARRLNKPLVLLKSGTTAAGARAVGFHTGSTPGEVAAFDALVKEGAVIHVDSMEVAADTALALRDGRRSKGRRLSIVTLSGGAGALASDAAVQIGLQINEPNAEQRAKLAAVLPAFGSSANPIDLTGGLLNDIPMLERVLRVVAADPDVDMILVVLGNADRGADALVEGLQAGYLATDKPFLVAWPGGSGRPRRRLLDLRIPTFAEPNRAVKALSRIADFSLKSMTSNGKD